MFQIFIFGLLLQIIVSTWTLLVTTFSDKNIYLMYVLIIQLIFGIICYIAVFKKSWTISYYFSFLSATAFVFYLIKIKPDLLYITSVIPLIFYDMFITGYSSYKRKEKKIQEKGSEKRNEE